MKKIAFILTQSLESPSGLGRYGPLARELVRRGHQVELFALHPAWEQLPQKRFVDRGVQVHYVSQMHVRKDGSQKQYFSTRQLLWIALLATLRLTWAVWRSKAEVLQVCKAQPFNLLAARLARRGRPIFVDCDDYEAASNKFNGRWQQRIVAFFEDGIVRYATLISTNTLFSRNRYRRLGFPAEKLLLLPNGVEKSRFATNPEAVTALRRQLNIPHAAPILLYLGTLGLASHPVDLLLHAFARLHCTHPQARLLLVGGGEDYAALQTLAVQLQIADQVIFTGRVPAESVAVYYALADVSVDPVHDDPTAQARFPLKIVESVFAGTPVVTSDVGDRGLVINGPALGTLVPPGDASALAKGLLPYLDKNREREPIPLDERKRWEWAELAKSVVGLYNRR